MGNPPRVAATLDRSSETLTLASVFQAFDRLRQQLSFEMYGTAGVFTGFTSLNTYGELLTHPETPTQIALTATVCGQSARSTRVEYEASFRRKAGSKWTTWVIARGTGVTIHPNTGRGDLLAARPATEKSTAAALA